MLTYLDGKIYSSIGVLFSLWVIFGLSIPKFNEAAQVLSDRPVTPEQIVSSMTPEQIARVHDGYVSDGITCLIVGIILLLISFFCEYLYFYKCPADDRRKEAEEDQRRLERKEAYELNKELELKEWLKENSPEIKEQREREAQAAFEHRKQELERTLRHGKNHAARELELEDLRMKIRDADREARGIRTNKAEEYTDRNAPSMQEDPLASVYLTTQEIDQIALQAFTRISILPPSQQHQAWVEWDRDLSEKYDELIRSEIFMCTVRLRN